MPTNQDPARENLVGKSCGKFLRENLAGNSCRKILREIVVGKSCGKFLRENLAGNSLSWMLIGYLSVTPYVNLCKLSLSIKGKNIFENNQLCFGN